MNIEVSKSNYICKALAILCVAAAHCANSTVPTVQSALELLGSLGVPVFLILSGYTLNVTSPAKAFWIKKLKAIGVPWLVYGCLTYALHIVADKQPLNLLDAVYWITGHGTWLYFVPVLLVCFAVFRVFKKRVFVCILVAISMAVVIIKALGFCRFSTVITDYQDSLGWIGYFGLGVLLKKVPLEKVLNIKIYIKVLIWILTVALGAVYIANCRPSYWTLFSIPMSLLFFLSLLLVSKGFGNVKLLLHIGQNTFPIYFLHMQLGINMLKILYGLIPSTAYAVTILLDILQPIWVVLVTYGLVLLIRGIAKLLRLDRCLWILALPTPDK